MKYEGGASSRIYVGLWRVLVVWEQDGQRCWGMSEPGDYETAETVVLLLGFGVPWEGNRATRALIVEVAA